MKTWLILVWICLISEGIERVHYQYQIESNIKLEESHISLLANNQLKLSDDTKFLAQKVKELDYEVEVLTELQKAMK